MRLVTRPAGMESAAGVADATVSWAAVTAWGSGLVALALGAGATTTRAAPDAASLWSGVALVVVGVVALGWGVVSLARGSALAPGSAMAGCLVAGAAGVLALAGAPARTSPFAVGALLLLLTVTALACAASARRRRPRAVTRARVSTVIIAAVAVAAIVTPVLAASESAQLAPGHGGHGIVDPGHH